MCSWSCGTLLWYVLPMVEGRQRDPTVGGKMFFPEAGHVESCTGTAAGSIRSCGCLYGCPTGTLNTPPSALARFISYPTQYVCFAPLQFQLSFLFNNNPSSSFPSYFFSSSACPPLENFAFKELASFILSTFTPPPPPPIHLPHLLLSHTSSPLLLLRHMGKEGGGWGGLMHLPWQDSLDHNVGGLLAITFFVTGVESSLGTTGQI